MNKFYHFLDYKIITCDNGDGIVLSKEGELYESHLGNFSTEEDAEKAAVMFFMIARPNEFATQVYHRTQRTHTMHDYFKFKNVCEKEKITIPASIGCSNDISCILTYRGSKI